MLQIKYVIGKSHNYVTMTFNPKIRKLWMIEMSVIGLLLYIAARIEDKFVDIECKFTPWHQDDKVNAYACKVLSLGLLYLEFQCCARRRW